MKLDNSSFKINWSEKIKVTTLFYWQNTDFMHITYYAYILCMLNSYANIIFLVHLMYTPTRLLLLLLLSDNNNNASICLWDHK